MQTNPDLNDGTHPPAGWNTPDRPSPIGVRDWRPIRGPRNWCGLGLCGFLATWLALVHAHAVVFYATEDVTHNTTAPTGELAGSGWQFQGSWIGFLGTPIAPNYFITASHIGGNVGDKFVFRGVTYTTTAMFDDPHSDLRLWRVCGTFPEFAPLYSKLNERAQPVIVFGRGTRRGDPVEVGGLLGPALKGWKWGVPDFTQRWGLNVVADVVDGDGLGRAAKGGTIGEILKLTFDPEGGPEECHLSGGDSGGGLFIKDGAVWKLAGINYGVDGPYNTTSSGAGFSAVIFDEGGLYEDEAGQWVLTPDLPTPQPGAFYATRIASNLAWIESVLNAPPPPDAAPGLQSAARVAGPYADDAAAVVDADHKTITVPRSSQARFFRVRSCSAVRIIGVRAEGESLVLTYE